MESWCRFFQLAAVVLLADSQRLFIDEVQKENSILEEIKQIVDDSDQMAFSGNPDEFSRYRKYVLDGSIDVKERHIRTSTEQKS